MRDEGYLENEGHMYQEMMQMYSKQLNNAYRYIGKLALLQHNNVPTRLLDITVNPSVALYFACEQNGIANDEDGYVFMYIRKGKSCHSPDVYIYWHFTPAFRSFLIEKLQRRFGRWK